jgi:IS1 family transposase
MPTSEKPFLKSVNSMNEKLLSVLKKRVRNFEVPSRRTALEGGKRFPPRASSMGGSNSAPTPPKGKTHSRHKIWLWTAVNYFSQGILAWVLGSRSAETFQPLWTMVEAWQCYFYVTDGWSVYPGYIPQGSQIICKTYMTRVEGENTRLRHYLARLHRKTLCYSKSIEMLKHSMRLLLHSLKFWDVPVPQ